MVSNLPATDYSWSSDFSVAGRPADAFGTEVVHRIIGGDYSKTMQTKLLAGRLFEPSDTRTSPLVVLINETLARRYFPNEDPIGKRVAFDRAPDSTSLWRTIVGVVSSERQSSIALSSRPEFLDAFAQDPDEDMTMVVRSSGDVSAIAPAMRRIVSELDPLLAISSLRSMDDVRGDSVSRERFVTVILLVFSIVGVVLADVGVYGAMSQTARGRTREMGIRIALGAPVTGVQWLLVRYGLKLSTIGIAIGLGVFLMSTTALSALLFEVKPIDGSTFAVVSVLITGASILASWFPASRASRVDAAITLRAE